MEWIIGAGLIVGVGFALYKLIRKDAINEVAESINQQTDDDITRIAEQARRIESDMSDPDDKWL